ncbi:Dehydroquinate synthase-like protein [Ascodesmis nigricans]|uniref:Dehydroquinate synthase-like protein n=1 Tax=Ascodesmis nigricans TaxID=341454 RepID=A0A4S2MTV6_9PEZI|nr:Dehydroquinate synthase-like protein [Ascodesmis nigricans]
MTTITIEPTFPFRRTTTIHHGAPFPTLLTNALTTLPTPPTRLYLLISKSLATNHPEVLTQLWDALGERLVGVRVGVTPHTPWEEVVEVAEECRKLNPDGLITLGGGSITDTAKLVALLLANPSSDGGPYSIPHLFHVFSLPSSALTPAAIPIISLPTTLSAAEYTPSTGSFSPTGKRKLSHPSLAPKCVLLDPELARLTPCEVWMQTAAKAVDHCVEVLILPDSQFPAGGEGDTEGIRAVAGDALKGLVEAVVREKIIATSSATPGERDNTSPVSDSNPREAEYSINVLVLQQTRLTALLSARHSISALTRTPPIPTGASHALTHHLATFGILHGTASAILLPAVCDDSYPLNSHLQDSVVDILIPTIEGTGMFEGYSREMGLGELLRRVFTFLDLPGKLGAVGVGEVVERVLEKGGVKGVRRLETREEVEGVLQRCA